MYSIIHALGNMIYKREESVRTTPGLRQESAISDSRVLFALLPEEIFRKILEEQLHGTEDLLSAAYASPVFFGILTEKPAAFFIGKVIETVGRAVESTDLLRMRAVCKKWNEVVMTHLSEFPRRLSLRRGVGELGNCYSHRDPFNKWDVLSNEDSLDSMVSGSFPRPSLPFVCNTVVLMHDWSTWPGKESEPGYWRKAREFLLSCGGHISNLTISWESHDNFLSFLVHALSCCSNIKYLYLGGYVYDNTNCRGEGYNKADLRKIPEITALEVLRVSADIEPMLLKTILSRCKQTLKKLEVTAESVVPMHLSNVEIYSRRVCNWRPVLLMELPRLSAAHIREIYIEARYTSESLVSMEELANQIGRLKCITVLDIYFFSLQFAEESFRFRDIPKDADGHASLSLESLRLSVSSDMTFEFLRCFPKLKHLELVADEYALGRERKATCPLSQAIFSDGPPAFPNEMRSILPELETFSYYKNTMDYCVTELRLVTAWQRPQKDRLEKKLRSAATEDGESQKRVNGIVRNAVGIVV